MEKYRFDDEDQKAYVYYPTDKAYVFLASYHQLDISSDMPRQEKIKAAEEYIEMNMYYQE